MAALFQRDKSVISRHVKNIFEEGELAREAVVAESTTTASDGKIEADVGFPLRWDEQKHGYISVGQPLKSVREELDWPKNREWLAERFASMYRVLMPRLRTAASQIGDAETKEG